MTAVTLYAAIGVIGQELPQDLQIGEQTVPEGVAGYDSPALRRLRSGRALGSFAGWLRAVSG